MRRRAPASYNDGNTGILRHVSHVSMKDHAYEINSATGQRIKLVIEGVAERLHEAGDEIKANGKSMAASVGVKVAQRFSKKLHRIADRIEIQAIKLQNKMR